MKANQIILILFLLFAVTFSCKQTEIVETATPISTLVGKWKLTEILKGDVIDKPCGINTLTRDITLEFTTNSSGMDRFLSLNGQSTVNDYSGGYLADSEGNIKIPTIGGTKRAGSREMMECEDNYYTFLTNAQAYRILQIQTIPVKTVLELGVFRDNPKDKGAYLIFEKN
jgi:heat shock protein HslJ